MKLELKNLKHAEFASHETHCYEATVYIDGKRAFLAENDGHGGSDMYSPLRGSNRAEVDAHIEAIAAAFPHEYKGMVFEGYACAEIAIGDLINETLYERALKKSLNADLKKSILYLNDIGELMQRKPKGKLQAGHLIMFRQSNPNFALLNDMPKAEALEVYRSAIG